MVKKNELPALHYLLADDFTGANDIGVALASSGLETRVIMPHASTITEPEQFCINVICTDSRDIDAKLAMNNIQQFSKHYDLVNKQRVLIKKVDSTLRGNIGSEIEALLTSGYQLAIVVIAAPYAKRKTIDGCCFVNNVRLSETEFASDPKSPITSSRIIDIIQAQTQLNSTEYVKQSQDSIHHEQKLKQLYELGNNIIVCDAESLEDLSSLYSAACNLTLPLVFVTTGELTQAIQLSPERIAEELPTSDTPILGIIGSMSRVTYEQVNHVVQHSDVKEIVLDLEQLLNTENSNYLLDISEAIKDTLLSKQHCMVRSCNDLSLRFQLADIANNHKITQNQLAERVRDNLTTIVQQVISSTSSTPLIGGLILCGGDIAIATANKLNASSFLLKGTAVGCMPWGKFELQETPFPVFTKAGGFGDQTTFTQLIQLIKKEVE